MGNKKKGKIKLPKSVKQLDLTQKQWAKKNGMPYGNKVSKSDRKANKKRAKKEYKKAMANGLNRAIQIITEHPNHKTSTVVKDKIETVLCDAKLMKKLAKQYTKHPEDYKHIKFLPGIILRTIVYYKGDNLTAEEQEIANEMNEEMLTNFCEEVLKKTRKKYEKSNLSRATAFSLAALLPTAKYMSPYWYKALINTLYDCAATETIDIEEVFKAIANIDKNKVVSKKEVRQKFFEEFIFMKKTNRFKGLNASQKEFHSNLQDAALTYLDGLHAKELKAILERYIKRRKKDNKASNDMDRMFRFTDHANSNSPYTTIKKVVEKLIKDDSDNEQYLG